jgi:hypothetical protein
VISCEYDQLSLIPEPTITVELTVKQAKALAKYSSDQFRRFAEGETDTVAHIHLAKAAIAEALEREALAKEAGEA